MLGSLSRTIQATCPARFKLIICQRYEWTNAAHLLLLIVTFSLKFSGLRMPLMRSTSHIQHEFTFIVKSLACQ